jgi:hypothetical protein
MGELRRREGPPGRLPDSRRAGPEGPGRPVADLLEAARRLVSGRSVPSWGPGSSAAPGMTRLHGRMAKRCSMGKRFITRSNAQLER